MGKIFKRNFLITMILFIFFFFADPTTPMKEKGREADKTRIFTHFTYIKPGDSIPTDNLPEKIRVREKLW